MTTQRMRDTTRPIGWVRAVRKIYETFPVTVRDRVSTALTIAAEGGKAEIDLVRARLGRLRKERLQ